MSKLQWDKVGEHFFETGVDHGVLYPMNDNGQTYDKGVAWNGLTAVTESPEGAEVTALYADNIKYLNLMSAEDFKATIEAYTYPDEFEQCDGSASIAAGVKIGQQARKTFGFCYRTKLGNDLNPELGYKIHIIYGATAAPSERAYATVNDSPEAITFSWEVSTIPVEVTGFKPTAHLELDSTKVAADKLALIEAALYGSESEDARLLMPDEIVAIINGEEPSVNQVAAPVLAKDDSLQQLSISQGNIEEGPAEHYDIFDAETGEYLLTVDAAINAETGAPIDEPTDVAYSTVYPEHITVPTQHKVKVKGRTPLFVDSEFSNVVTIELRPE